ncbi:MAG: hypothetical protein IAG10_08260 [Planctomycetaceae bacterium]|nr:hypothetical protein [Planctomycetaceae bacterium]
MFSQSTSDRPKRLAIPRSRRLVIDLLRLSKHVPTTAHDRIIDLSVVATAREHAAQRVSWSILFIKAFAIVSAKYPPLRQIYMRWPWPHLYQHPHSDAIVVTHREVDGEPWIFWSNFFQPETKPLTQMQARLDRYLTDPVPLAFHKQWKMSALPSWLRRMAWWSLLNISGQRRVRRCGTFFLTTISSRGAEIRHPPGFLTGGLTFGPIDERGYSRVTLAYDHRLLDGRMVADILADLEQTLNGVIAEELAAISAEMVPDRLAA